MRIQHNIMAMNAYRNYTTNNSALSKNLEKLSSGYKINRAGDDAAGLAISEKMRAQITGLETAQKNAKDGISLVQTAEGALTEVHDMLNRMVELADQSANGTYDNEVDRANLQKEVDQLRAEIDRIADSANFNGIKLLNGDLGDAAGITEGQTDAINATTVGSLLTGDMVTAVTKGSLSEGKAEVQAQSSFYMVDSLQASISSDGTTQQNTKFELVLRNGSGSGTDSITVTFSITSTDTSGGTTKIDMNSIVAMLMSGGGDSNAKGGFTLSGVDDNATATITISGNTVGGGPATWDDIKDLYNITYEDNELVVKANKTSGMSSTGVSADKLGATIKVTYSANSKDEAELTEQLKNDLDGTDGATPPANITLGYKSKADIAGAKEVKASYTVSSATIELKSDIKSGDAIKIGDKTYLMIEKGATLNSDLQVLVDSLKKNGSTTVSFVEFDSSKTADADTDDGNAVYELMKAINKDSDTTHIDAKSATGTTIQLQETQYWGNQIIADPDTNKTVDLSATTIKASDLKYGGSGSKGKLTLSDELQKGTTVTIGGKKFEFGTDESKIAAGNTMVAFTEGDAEANAQALVDALTEAGITATVSADDPAVVELSEGVEAEDISSKGLTLQIGDTSDNYNQLSVAIHATDCESLGIDKLSIADQTSAADAVDTIKAAINEVSSIRGTLGATQNRLDHTINNLSVMTENIQDAESTIRDTDVAEEMMAYTKNNILIQSAQAMLAQANQVPQGVLQLLQ